MRAAGEHKPLTLTLCCPAPAALSLPAVGVKATLAGTCLGKLCVLCLHTTRAPWAQCWRDWSLNEVPGSPGWQVPTGWPRE